MRVLEISIISIIFLVFTTGILESFAEEWDDYFLIGKYYHSDPHEEDEIFIIPYQISNGSFSRMEFNQVGTLRIDIYHTVEDGTFEFKFPRNYPYSNGIFDDFLVLISGEESLNYKKIDTECYYQFHVPFKAGTRQIELINGILITKRPLVGEEVSQECTNISIEKFSIFEFPPKGLPHVYKGCPPGQLKTNLHSVDWFCKPTPNCEHSKFVGLQKCEGRPGYSKYVLPLAQLRGGVHPLDVMCVGGYEKIFKSTDNSPACVKPESIPKLIERGWAKK